MERKKPKESKRGMQKGKEIGEGCVSNLANDLSRGECSPCGRNVCSGVMSQPPVPSEIQQFYSFDKMCTGCLLGGSRGFAETQPKMEATEKGKMLPWCCLNDKGGELVFFPNRGITLHNCAF